MEKKKKEDCEWKEVLKGISLEEFERVGLSVCLNYKGLNDKICIVCW